jgi:hypothetical protein
MYPLTVPDGTRTIVTLKFDIRFISEAAKLITQRLNNRAVSIRELNKRSKVQIDTFIVAEDAFEEAAVRATVLIPVQVYAYLAVIILFRQAD